MYRKLACLVLMLLLVSVVVAQDMRTYERVTKATGTFYDTIATAASQTALGVSPKIRIFEAASLRGYDACIWSFIVNKLDTVTNSWAYVDSLNKLDTVIVRVMAGQNGFYQQIGTHTTTGANQLPDTFNIEYGFPADSIAAMLFDSMWFDVHVYDSVITTACSALVDIDYQYKLIEFFNEGDK